MSFTTFWWKSGMRVTNPFDKFMIQNILLPIAGAIAFYLWICLLFWRVCGLRPLSTGFVARVGLWPISFTNKRFYDWTFELDDGLPFTPLDWLRLKRAKRLPVPGEAWRIRDGLHIYSDHTYPAAIVEGVRGNEVTFTVGRHPCYATQVCHMGTFLRYCYFDSEYVHSDPPLAIRCHA
jgi:hypothetical protein